MKKIFVLLFCFLFVPSGADESTRFVVLGDRTRNAVEQVFSEIIDEISLLHPDFVINVGDLIEITDDDSTLVRSEWKTVLNAIQMLPCDFYFVPGSNDVHSDLTRDIYEHVTGRERYYSFDRDNSHFVVLDNSTAGWSPLPDADPEQFAWLLADLENNKDAEHIFVFLHVPAYLNALTAERPSQLMETFRNYRVRAVFSGSLHSYMYLNEDGTDYIVMGSSGAETADMDPAKGNFYHYLLVTLNDGEYDAAVIRKGSIFMRNVVTASDYVAIQRAQNEVVSFPELFLNDGPSGGSHKCRFYINNTGIDSIISPMLWYYDTLRYSIAPSEIPVAVAPEETEEYEFDLEIKDNSKTIPLPRFALVFPFTYGKVCTLKGSMGARRVKSVKRFGSPPIIDGVLEANEWGQIRPITELASANGDESQIERCEVYIGHDEEYVYIGTRCLETDMNTLQILAAEQDGPVYADDNVWFFFDTNRDEQTYYQLMINPAGVVFDRYCSIEQGHPQTDAEWNGPWVVKAGREPAAWVIEMSVPKNALAPFDAKKWGFNFRRLQTKLAQASYWSVPFGHNPESFGIVEFD
jgi:hypothetical protein